jgi:hypothetical protein
LHHFLEPHTVLAETYKRPNTRQAEKLSKVDSETWGEGDLASDDLAGVTCPKFLPFSTVENVKGSLTLYLRQGAYTYESGDIVGLYSGEISNAKGSNMTFDVKVVFDGKVKYPENIRVNGFNFGSLGRHICQADRFRSEHHFTTR